jgi:hypothetical protein
MTQLAIRLFHIEALAKTQIAEDVEYQVRDLISHIDWAGPTLTLFLTFTKQLQPAVDIGMHKDLCTSQCALRKRIVDHAALFGVYRD